MERFDGEFHSGGLGAWQERADAGFDLFEVLFGRLADRRATNHDDHRQADELGFFQGLQVLIDRFFAIRCGQCGEKSATDEGNRSESAIGEMGSDFFQILACDGFTPDGNSTYACAGVILDAFSYRPRLIGKGMDGELLWIHGFDG